MRLGQLKHPEDLRDLTPDQQRRVVGLLAMIREQPTYGRPLASLKEHQVHRGDMSHCRVAHVPGYEKLALRVVYTVTGDTVDVIAIGRRFRSEVYQTAAARLYPKKRVRRMRR